MIIVIFFDRLNSCNMAELKDISVKAFLFIMYKTHYIESQGQISLSKMSSVGGVIICRAGVNSVREK